MDRRVSRGKIVAVASVAALLVLAFYLWRDLNLPRTVDLKKMPDVVVENLTFERTIEDRNWLIRATRAEHHEGVISARSVDIKVEEPATKNRSHVTARSGEFTQESANFELSTVTGSALLKDRSVDWSAPLARYDSSMDIWTFDGGIVARDSNSIVSGEFGTITPAGIFKLEKGAEARWNVDE